MNYMKIIAAIGLAMVVIIAVDSKFRAIFIDPQIFGLKWHARRHPPSRKIGIGKQSGQTARRRLSLNA